MTTPFGKKRVSAVKIDVEGRELSVLEGMRKVIRHHQPVVIFEVLTPRLRRFLGQSEDPSRLRDLVSFFQGVGYEVERLGKVDYLALPRGSN